VRDTFSASSRREGENFGEYETVVPNGSFGYELFPGDGRRFRLLEILPAPEGIGGYSAFWTVESLD
jgi:hypothetical protein